MAHPELVSPPMSVEERLSASVLDLVGNQDYVLDESGKVAKREIVIALDQERSLHVSQTAYAEDRIYNRIEFVMQQGEEPIMTDFASWFDGVPEFADLTFKYTDDLQRLLHEAKRKVPAVGEA